MTTTQQTTKSKYSQMLKRAVQWFFQSKPKSPAQPNPPQKKIRVAKIQHANENTEVNVQSGSSSPSPESDGVNFCYSLRHGGNRVRRELKARGKSAAGISFEVLECPECGRFAGVRRDSVNGSLGILFSGKYYRADYTTSRQGQLRDAFRTVRAGHAAA